MFDPLYVQARGALLDAADALEAHLDAVVLVGAQAIYVHTGEADLAVAEYTTDADFAVNETARPFDWRFTRDDLAEMLERLEAHRPEEALAA